MLSMGPETGIDNEPFHDEATSPGVTVRADSQVPPDGPPASYWTRRRLEVHRWLEASAPALAPVYAAAVQMAMDETFPGRLWFVAHAVREIRNRLPDALAGETVASRTEYSQLAEEVLLHWMKDGLPADGSLPVVDAAEPTASGPVRYEISYLLLVAVAGLVAGHLAVADRNQENARRLFEVVAGGPIPQYVVRAWMRGTKWANAFAHVRNKPLRPSDESPLAANFEAFEEALMAIASRSYENMDEHERHNDKVRQTVPPNKLLVWKASEGW